MYKMKNIKKENFKMKQVLWSVVGLLSISFLALAQVEDVQVEGEPVPVEEEVQIEGVYKNVGYACENSGEFHITYVSDEERGIGVETEFNSDGSVQMVITTWVQVCKVVGQGSYTVNDSEITITITSKSISMGDDSCDGITFDKILPLKYILEDNVLYLSRKGERGWNNNMFCEVESEDNESYEVYAKQ